MIKYFMSRLGAKKNQKTKKQGVLKEGLNGEALPQGPTSYPFIYHFS